MSEPDDEYSYQHAREFLREGAALLAQNDEQGASETERQIVASNIVCAYERLTEEASPYKNKLGEPELRTVAIARALLSNNAGSGRAM